MKTLVQDIVESKSEGGKMSTSMRRLSGWTTVGAIALSGLFLGTVRDAQAAVPTACRPGPVVKNLMALKTAPCEPGEAVRGELTRSEVRKLTATAESREDHFKIALYYKAAADRLGAQGAGYEEAAAAYRHGPIVKNLMAPNTAARYDSFAKGLREEANCDRALASEHEQMAKTVVAGF